VNLTPGLNDVSANLWAAQEEGGEATLVHNQTIWVYRVASSAQAKELKDVLENRYQHLILDPGVDVSLREVDLRVHTLGSYSLRTLDVILHEGSVLSIDGRMEVFSDFLNLQTQGPGTFSISNLSIGILDLSSKDTTIHISDMEITHSIDSYRVIYSNVTFLNVDFVFAPWNHTMQLTDSNLTFKGCDMQSPVPIIQEVELAGNSSGELIDCTFVNVTAQIKPSTYSLYTWSVVGFNVTWTVSSCEFSGTCSFLSLVDQEWLMYMDAVTSDTNLSYKVVATGNRFVGPNTGVFGDPERLLMVGSTQELVGGARLLAGYHIPLDVNGSYYNGPKVFFMDGARALDTSFVGLYYRHWKDGIAIIDVTEDLNSVLGPGSTWVMIRKGRQGSGPALWFIEVPTGISGYELTVPDWVSMSWLVDDYVYDLETLQ
jgi:hypothetical protein